MAFQPGTRIIAIRNFGLIREGQCGVVTGTAETPFFFWTRTMYLCTFEGNVKVAARPREVDDYDHGLTLAELERNADDVSLDEMLGRMGRTKKR